MSGTIGERACLQYACHDTAARGEAAEFHAMPGKRFVQFEKAASNREIQGRIGEGLKAQYVAEAIPDRLAELLEQLAQLELLKELAQLIDEPDSKGG
jgi:hypothetical protein